MPVIRYMYFYYQGKLTITACITVHESTHLFVLWRYDSILLWMSRAPGSKARPSQ